MHHVELHLGIRFLMISLALAYVFFPFVLHMAHRRV
jgi:hypothetical protein